MAEKNLYEDALFAIVSLAVSDEKDSTGTLTPENIRLALETSGLSRFYEEVAQIYEEIEAGDEAHAEVNPGEDADADDESEAS